MKSNLFSPFDFDLLHLFLQVHTCMCSLAPHKPLIPSNSGSLFLPYLCNQLFSCCPS